MDFNTTLLKLQIITALDSITYGLIYSFLAPYIVSLGANQFIVGILTVGNIFCTLLSSHIISNFAQIHGKYYTLHMILNAAMVSHIMLALTPCFWYSILWRYIFCLTNQSQNLCKDLILQNAPEDKQECFLKKYRLLNGSGFIIGPFITGCMFDIGFGYVCLLAAALTSINAYLMLGISLEHEEPRDPSSDREEHTVTEKAQNDICDMIQDCKNAECESNWDILAMKYLYLSSVLVFTTKFTQILKHNFKASHFVIGYTTSYMNALNFAGMFIIDSIKNYLPEMPILKVIQYGCLSSAIFLLIACYSPIYILYALMCGPILFTFNFMNTAWADFALTRENESLYRFSKYIGVLVGLTTPLVFGFLHNITGHHAAIILSTVPIFVAMYILKKHTSRLFMENGEKLKQD